MKFIQIFLIMDSNTNGVTYFCGIDGSPAAFNSFQLVLHDVFREDCDKIVLGHVFDTKKEDDLPFDKKQQYIQDTYESKIIHLG